MATSTTRKATKTVARTASGKRIGRPPGSKNKSNKATSTSTEPQKSEGKKVVRKTPDTFTAVESPFDEQPMTRNEVIVKGSTTVTGRLALTDTLNRYAAQYRQEGLLDSDKFYPVLRYKNRETAVAVARRINRWHHYKKTNSSDWMRNLDVLEGERWEAFLLKDDGPFYAIRLALYGGTQ